MTCAFSMQLLAAASSSASPPATNALAEGLLFWIAQALIFGTVLALLTWSLLGTVLRRARPAIHASLWLVVIIKFLAPVGPGWSYSLANLTTAAAPWLRPAPAVVETPRSIEADSDAITTIFLIAPGATQRTAAARPVAASGPNALRPSLTSGLAGAYLLGLVIVIAVRIWKFAAFARYVRRLPIAPEPVCALVADTARRMRLRRGPAVRLSDDAPAPFVVGGRRPTLVLPTIGFANRDECEAVILHELAHLRRHDLLVRYAQWLAGTVLYFWPVVAWVNRRIDLAREAACDEWALRCGSLSPAQYARCLLKCMRPRRFGWTAYAPAAMAANVFHVERRIEMILNTSTHARRNRMTALLGGACLLGWTGFVMSGASAALPASSDPPATSPQSPAAFPSATSWEAARQIEPSSPHAVRLQLAERSFQLARIVPTQIEGFNLSLQLERQAFAFGQLALDGAAAEPTMVFMSDGEMQFPSSIGVDLDDDGAVSRDEQHAYLTALAMRDAAKVLEKYPSADENGDGILAADEASNLLQADTSPVDATFGFSSVAGAFVPQGLGQSDGDAVAREGFEIRIDGAVGAEADCTELADVHAVVEGVPLAGMQSMVFVAQVDGDCADAAESQNGRWVTAEGIEVQPGIAARQIVVRVAGEAPGEHTITVSDPSDETTGHANTAEVFVAAGSDEEMQSGMAVPVVGHRIVVAGVDGQAASDAIPVDADGRARLVVTAGHPLGSMTSVVPGHQIDEPAAVWLISQAMGDDAKLSADEVRAVATPVTDASLKRFLRRHPRSDSNGDGALTVAERDQYLRDTQSRRNKKLLERFPQADADGNGALTDEEIRDYFRNRTRTSADETGSAVTRKLRVQGTARVGEPNCSAGSPDGAAADTSGLAGPNP